MSYQQFSSHNDLYRNDAFKNSIQNSHLPKTSAHVSMIIQHGILLTGSLTKSLLSPLFTEEVFKTFLLGFITSGSLFPTRCPHSSFPSMRSSSHFCHVHILDSSFSYDYVYGSSNIHFFSFLLSRVFPLRGLRDIYECYRNRNQNLKTLIY